ncbi:MAG: lysozyme [Burkholderiaceae bacterium]|jgi:lysozyme|nr:lysozyme [Burkholderiaceae bacterium]
MEITVSPFPNFFVRPDLEDAPDGFDPPDGLDAANAADANGDVRVTGSAEADSASANSNRSAADIIRKTSRDFELRIAAAKAKAAASTPQAAASAASTNAANMSVSDAGLQMIEGFETRHLTAYRDGAGVPTIGYGHTGDVDGKPITSGMTITADYADQLLPGDLATAEATVRNNVHVPITQGQFDALTDFTFNLGAGKLEGSTLLTKLNAKDYTGAQAEFGRWVYGTQKDRQGSRGKTARSDHPPRGGSGPVWQHGAASRSARRDLKCGLKRS